MATDLGSSTGSAGLTTRRRSWRQLPVIHQLRQSVGLQRGMLVAGLVLMGIFLLAAIFAPLLAVIVAVTNFIVDIIAALIDPRVRY
jgi:hypothetical protein